MTTSVPSPVLAARRLLRSRDRATLATSLEGWPYASLVLVATGQDAAPLLLLSQLAEHTRNVARDPRVSLLFDGTGALADPLTGARVTVLGEIAAVDDEACRARFLARHPSAEAYAGFRDFAVYRLTIARAHLVAGFGRIDWIDGAALRYDTAAAGALAAAEAGILAHMNADHREALDHYARLVGRDGSGWQATGIDPEGLDLRLGGAVARIDFQAPVMDAAAARAELLRLARIPSLSG